jgi:nitrite reductase/ring-hydroxylating ferredoxin subunit
MYNPEKYSRYEFLKNMGFRGAALMAVLASCVRPEDSVINAVTLDANGNVISNPTGTPSTDTPTTGVAGTSIKLTTAELNALKNVVVKIDLSASASANLKTVGGYIIVNNNNVVVSQTAKDTYAAVANLCTHEPKKRIIWDKTQWYCTDHGATFSVAGSPTNNVAPRAITAYKVATDGQSLVIYS